MSRKVGLVLGVGAALWATACGPSVDVPDTGVMPMGNCTPNPTTQGLEICNGQDDDCDGMTDEGPSGQPLRQACQSACGGGTEQCALGTFSGCNARQPGTELCNSIDDNCDGQIDEGCGCVHGMTRPCGEDRGACRSGLEQCLNGQWSGQCMGAMGPAASETCNNGIDDDCNGDTDEGCQCTPNDTLSCGSDVGECMAGTLTCDQNSRWGTCQNQVMAGREVCNGLDDDCDGEDDWSTAADFGWRADSREPNESCGTARALANTVDGGDWITVPVSDSADLRTYPTLYPMGDVDWYHFTAETVSHGACLPGTSQCAFVLVVQLELTDESMKDNYRVCLATSSDCNQVGPQTTICTDSGHWNAAATSYLLAIKWGGTCGADDSREVKARVESMGATQACGYYQLHARFYFDPNETCP